MQGRCVGLREEDRGENSPGKWSGHNLMPFFDQAEAR